jgi:arylsulfatase A-like enzyme
MIAWFLVVTFVAVRSAELPNFVILFADDMGSGDPSIYGHPTIRTPNIDQLAHDGIRFTQWNSIYSMVTT